MKKTVILFFILCLCICVSAETLKNGRMSLSFEKGEKNNIFLTEIKDVSSGVNFIKNTDGTQNIWSIKARADRDFGGEDIWLSSMHAEKFSSETSGNTVRFIWKNVKNDLMTITSKSEEGNVKEEIIIDKTGEDIEIGFNSKYLLDSLKVIDDEVIDMYMINSKAPCFIKDADQNYIYLILPVNFNNVG